MPSRRRTPSRSERPQRGASRYGLRPARLAPRTIDNDNWRANDTEHRKLIHNPPRSRRASTPGQCSVGTGGQSSVGAHSAHRLAVFLAVTTDRVVLSRRTRWRGERQEGWYQRRGRLHQGLGAAQTGRTLVGLDLNERTARGSIDGHEQLVPCFALLGTSFAGAACRSTFTYRRRLRGARLVAAPDGSHITH